MTQARLLRRILQACAIALVSMLFVLVAVPHVARTMARDVFVARGSSMSPAIPAGALIVLRQASAADLAVGDIVTLRLPTGSVVTQRVVATDHGADGALLVRRDAGADADATLVAAADVIGEVEGHVPYVGVLLAALSAPSGVIAAMTLLGALMLASWSIEDREARARTGRINRQPVATALAAES